MNALATKDLRPSDSLTDLADAFGTCITALLAMCDGAVKEDGIGFNKPDAGWARKVANIPTDVWTYDDVATACKRLRKYQNQLASYGVDFNSIPRLPSRSSLTDAGGHAWAAWAYDRDSKRATWDKEQADAAIAAESHICWLPEYNLFHLSFPRTRHDAREALKANVPGRRWDASRYVWTVPPSSGKALVEFLASFPFATPGEDTQRKLAEVSANCPAPEGVTLDGDKFSVRFSFNREAVAAIREIQGRKWDADNQRWTVPSTDASVAALTRFCDTYSLSVSADAQKLLGAVSETSESNLVASSAHTADIEIPGLGGELRDYQKAGVAYVASAKSCILGDDMGLGKTIQALASAQYMNAYPLVIVCPATLKRNWERESLKWLPGKSVQVISGRKGGIPRADITILNYDIVKGRMDALSELNPAGVIFDESHALKNKKAQRTQACAKLAKGRELVLEMTGTPVMNRPSELISQLDIIGKLSHFGGFWSFATRYCGAYRDNFGLQWGTPRHLDELNEKLRRYCFIRREKADVLTELPPKQRQTITIDMASRKEYDRVAANTSRWLAERKAADEDFLSSIAHLSGDERRAEIARYKASAEWRADQAEQLTRIEALKQSAAEQKLPAVIEWVRDAIEGDQKLVLFAHHRNVQNALIEAFPDCVHILGDDSADDRDRAVQSFQNDPSAKLIVCSLQAAGVGITLTAASQVAFMELGWTAAIHDQAEDRCHRIGQTDSVNAYYLLADDSIDEDIWELIESKRSVAGEITATITTGDLVSRLAARA